MVKIFQNKIIKREKFDINVDMITVKKYVQSKQQDIATATKNRNWNLAFQISAELINSEEARITAVQHITNNKGTRSSGNSIETFNTNKDYLKMIDNIKLITTNPELYRATALDRVYIPKKNSSKMRPISIPSYTDRCLQALYKLALEPYGETLMDPDPSSYGFRPIVNCQ